MDGKRKRETRVVRRWKRREKERGLWVAMGPERKSLPSGSEPLNREGARHVVLAWSWRLQRESALLQARVKVRGLKNDELLQTMYRARAHKAAFSRTSQEAVYYSRR